MVAKVPQFIEVEDKIFGPLTFKQFLYIVGGAAGCFVIWSILPKIIAIFLVLPLAGLALALAFYEVNKRPFVVMLESFVRYHLGSKLYLWNKSSSKIKSKAKEKEGQELRSVTSPKLSESKLAELAWSLDVNQNVDR
jgi:hypothetical protein